MNNLPVDKRIRISHLILRLCTIREIIDHVSHWSDYLIFVIDKNKIILKASISYLTVFVLFKKNGRSGP